jgi:hypothetical protein
MLKQIFGQLETNKTSHRKLSILRTGRSFMRKSVNSSVKLKGNNKIVENIDT